MTSTSSNIETLFPDKIVPPDLDKAAIDQLIDDPDGETKAQQSATHQYHHETGYTQEDGQERISALEQEKQSLTEQKQDKEQELRGTPQFRFIKTKELIDEFASPARAQIWLMFFLAAAGLPLLGLSTSLVATQSTRFEFLLEWPLAAVMFLFVPLMAMWLVAWIDELIKQDANRWLYRFSLALSACAMALVWVFCFVLANSLDASTDVLEAGSLLVDGLFISQLITQVSFEILCGGILKISIFHKLDEPYQTKDVPVLKHQVLQASITQFDDHIGQINHDITVISKHLTVLKNGCEQHVTNALSYLRSEQRKVDHMKDAARKKADADAANHEFKLRYPNHK